MKALSQPMPFEVSDSKSDKAGKRKLPLLDDLLREQEDLSAVERFSQRHDDHSRPLLEPIYRDLLPASPPSAGEQYAFEVDLDACTGCKACVVGCHSLNGLDDTETWRSVGTLRGTDTAQLRTVTTACHHCVDPACMIGCPVDAYEKDPDTGIVRHLDDQCIGCQYCTFTCPYEVPQFNARLGIVRKCDMCSDRLGAGEAPACVQSCPNGAISIRIVKTEDAKNAAARGEFLPTTPDPTLTRPTTRYVGRGKSDDNVLPADDYAVRPAHNHAPLMLMLVLIQGAVGVYLADALLADQLSAGLRAALATLAMLVTLVALAASTMHLGRPAYAFRALLGLGHSWVSREILAFGVFAGAAGAHTVVALQAAIGLDIPVFTQSVAEQLLPLTALGAAVTGLLGVLSSMMLYHVTGRVFWHASRTTPRFLLSTALLGTAGATAVALSAVAFAGSPALPVTLVRAAALAWIAFTLVKLSWESQLAHRGSGSLERTASLLRGPLAQQRFRRILCALLGGVALPFVCVWAAGAQSPRFGAVGAVLALGFCLAGELIERQLFFTAVASPRMPGDTP